MSSQQGNQIHALEAVLLAAGVGQKIGDDVVEAIGLADHNLQKVPLLGIQGGRIRQHADRTGNRGQGIADFVRDGGGQAAHRSQAILHAHFALQAADLGEVVKGIDKAQVAARAHIERGNHAREKSCGNR